MHVKGLCLRFYDEMYLSLRVFVRGDSIWFHVDRFVYDHVDRRMMLEGEARLKTNAQLLL